MKSNYLISNNIAIFTLNPEDKHLDDMGVKILQTAKKEFVHSTIFDLALFDVISSEDIAFIEKLVQILKLHNIEVIVCNFNVYSASILFHFVENISFKTELNVQKAMDAIKSNKKK
ncbi:hypothetical protein [Halarcobacter anaerophilus]|jgi:hypothetical protein|uniref:STAS domain-containing protein n=1 Tax=Halarcobacter anaerophilus TaxID=877500 RepID=A0A4Q0XX84_9BACT|nr:hypothetical protein [Halarcobacter anaerophilus]QDF30254.1 hypothetical protein AANAER_2811 [Halarcobacter anaerophilus]RXJ62187.1 hypothetical protein CRV06_10500 [Halarcobacter anaerophilus]